MEQLIQGVIIEAGPNNPFQKIIAEACDLESSQSFFIESIEFLSSQKIKIKLYAPPEKMAKIKAAVIKEVPLFLASDISCEVEGYNLDLADDILIKRAIKELSRKYPHYDSFLRTLDFKLQDNSLLFKTPNQACFKSLEQTGFVKAFTKTLKEFGLNKQVELEIDHNFTPLIYENNTASKPKNKVKPPQVLRGKNILQPPMPIKEAYQKEGWGVIEGKLFAWEKVALKKGGYLYILLLTDFEDSMTVKAFKLNNDPQKGCYYRIAGKIELDSYSQENVLMAGDIVEVKPPLITDSAPLKRVELHLHTKMSDMDGLIEAEALAETLSKYQHQGAAITDHGVVQAFPSFYQAFAARDLKMILGLEGNVIFGDNPIVSGKENVNLHQQQLVFLDLETTGLTPWGNEIIEIGAIKVSQDKITEFQRFVKPQKMPDQTVLDLTGIELNQLKTAPSLAEIWPEFLALIKDTVIIAHNAEFDINFLKARAKIEKLAPLNHLAVIDTLNLSRALNKDFRSHSLGNLAKKFGIKIDNHHRALADAQATRNLWLAMQRLPNFPTANTLLAFKELAQNISWKNIFPHHVTILAQNQKGLQNLYSLVTISHLEYFFRRPCILKKDLEKYRKGLLFGSGCLEGLIYQKLLAGVDDEAIIEQIKFFDYVEVLSPQVLLKATTITDLKQAEKLTQRLIKLAKSADKKAVAVSNAHYLTQEDHVFHDILSHQGNPLSKSAVSHLKTTTELLQDFAFLSKAQREELIITNSQMIFEMIEDVKPVPDGLYPPKMERETERIKEMTWEKAISLYNDPLPPLIQQRIQQELKGILDYGYASIYLISHLLVKKSLELGYLVGSRGSVGSSLVAFLCDITEINPLPPHYRCGQCFFSEFFTDSDYDCGLDLAPKKCPHCQSDLIRDGFNIPFEVFLGFKGEKVPDIDLNFAGEIQGLIHNFTEEIFGSENVFRAGTISTVATKTAYGFVRGYLSENNITKSNAEIERLVQGCSGVRRTTGQHPGGLMVVPATMDIHQFTPLQRPANDLRSKVTTTHFDYHSIASRLLKLDLLGHEDPSTLKMLQNLTGVKVADIPAADRETMSIFSSKKALALDNNNTNKEVGTEGISEFGTPFVRSMLVETRPKTFSELIRISGLSHGTDVWLNNAQDLIKQKIATLKQVICTREDIMNNLIRWGLADDKAFKIMEKVRKGRGLSAEEEKELKANKVPNWYIESCKKIKYMFPKAHAAAYVLMSYRVAYFKVHYPLAYYAAYFTSKAKDFNAQIALEGLTRVKQELKLIKEKGNDVTAKERGSLTVLEVLKEAFQRKISFVPVDIYHSEPRHFVVAENSLRPPLICLEGLGENCAQKIVKARTDKEFSSIQDFVSRTQANKNVVLALKKHGALTDLPENNQPSLFE